MNKLFSLSVIPLAATAAVASTMLASAPVQAFSLNGVLDVAGVSDFSLGANKAIGGNDDSLTIESAKILDSSTGSFASWYPSVTVTNLPLVISLKDVASNSFGTTGTLPTVQAYSATGAGLVTFSNGYKFVAYNPFDAGLLKYGSANLLAASFKGYFADASDKSVAEGYFTAQGPGKSYSISVQAVPEPLTIIGSGIALGFGGFLKRKQKASEKTS